jgi:hypothetical protein
MVQPFQTPPNEQSFSGLIDAAILATGKPNQLIAAVQFANLVVRECQALGLFARDLIEDGFSVTDGSQTVSLNRPPLFRSLRTVKYTNANIYPELALPGKKQKNKTHYYYGVDNYFVFAGAPTGETIAYAMYYWQKPLGYYAQLGVNTSIFPGGPYTTRPAYYDLNEGIWKYLNSDEDAYVDTTGDPDEDIARQLLTGNWLTQDWYDLILSGTKTKIWNSAGDPRGNTEYSNYKQLQKTMQFSTAYEGEGF